MKYMRCWVHEAPEIIVQILCISIFFCRYVFHRRSALMFRDTSERCVCTIAICHTDIKKHTRSKRSKRMRAVTHTHTHPLSNTHGIELTHGELYLYSWPQLERLVCAAVQAVHCTHLFPEAIKYSTP